MITKQSILIDLLNKVYKIEIKVNIQVTSRDLRSLNIDKNSKTKKEADKYSKNKSREDDKLSFVVFINIIV